jgi:serine/threonine-protein kinase RsbT
MRQVTPTPSKTDASIQTTTIRSRLDLVTARLLAREHAQRLGFAPLDQMRITTAVQALASNILQHARTGTITVQALHQTGQVGIEIICADQGPGIADVPGVLAESHTNRRGLATAQRLMDTLTVQSQLGQGTTVTSRKWRT